MKGRLDGHEEFLGARRRRPVGFGKASMAQKSWRLWNDNLMFSSNFLTTRASQLTTQKILTSRKSNSLVLGHVRLRRPKHGDRAIRIWLDQTAKATTLGEKVFYSFASTLDSNSQPFTNDLDNSQQLNNMAFFFNPAFQIITDIH